MCIKLFQNFKIILLYFFFFFRKYKKLSKSSSTKNYEDNKERLQKNLVKDIKVYVNKKKKNNHNMILKNTKISQEMKNKRFLSLD